MTRPIRLFIDPRRCQTCRRCLALAACNVRAMRRIDLDEPPYLDAARCLDCRVCIPACPFGAVALRPAAPLA